MEFNKLNVKIFNGDLDNHSSKVKMEEIWFISCLCEKKMYAAIQCDEAAWTRRQGSKCASGLG